MPKFVFLVIKQLPNNLFLAQSELHFHCAGNVSLLSIYYRKDVERNTSLTPFQRGADYTQKVNKLFQIIDAFITEGESSRLNDKRS